MRVLMKLLYAARLARYDLQRAINTLGSYVHKWNQECEEDLYRLMCYVNSSLKVRQYAWVGDHPENIDPHLYADADFAGCTATSRSTNGAHLCLRGNNTYFSLSGTCKKQDCVSHSTPEAELVAAAFAIRKEGLPATYVWDTLLQPGQKKRKIVTVFHEDNQTMIRAVKSGRNPTMRHMGRTHYVQIKWLQERFKAGDLSLKFTPSAKQMADIYTKPFDNAARWQTAQENIACLLYTSPSPRDS